MREMSENMCLSLAGLKLAHESCGSAPVEVQPIIVAIQNTLPLFNVLKMRVFKNGLNRLLISS